jgi:hypothetical protein
MAGTKLVRQLDALKARAANARKNARDNKADVMRKAVNGLTSFAIGKAKKDGLLADIPTIPHVSRIVTLSIIANGAGMIMSKGGWKDALDGVGESTLGITLYEWGQGAEVAGDLGDPDGVHGVDVCAGDSAEVAGRRRRRRRGGGTPEANPAAPSPRTSNFEQTMADRVREQMGARGPSSANEDEFANYYVDV